MVADFFQSVLNDDRINKYYIDNVSDIPKLHTTLIQKFSYILGGPNLYSGEDIKNIHKNMHITP